MTAEAVHAVPFEPVTANAAEPVAASAHSDGAGSDLADQPGRRKNEDDSAANGFAAPVLRAEVAKNARTDILIGPNSPDRRNDSQQITKTMSQMSESADCVLNFGEFLEEAKSAEIHLLGEILSEWRNWSGSLRRGNFLRGVADAVLAGESGRDLSRWPAARRKSP